MADTQEPQQQLPPPQQQQQRLKVFLADDHGFVREGLRSLINAQPDMEVIGEAADGEAAVRQVRDCSAQIVVMDLSMPGMSGTEATVEICRTCPDTKVVALSMHEDATYLRGILEAGASGYVLKRSATQELVQAIRSVAAGGTHLDPALAAKLVEVFVRKKRQQPAAAAAHLRGEIEGQELSEREESVLRLIAQGHSNKEIAEHLSVSVKTVESYKARAMEKLGIKKRSDIVRYAAAQGWLQDL